ncbi:MAG: PAS domain S-box protein [Acidimicrobiia bacterium]
MAIEHDLPTPGIEALADLVFVIDGDTTIRSVNGAIRRVLGFPPADLIGSSALGLVHPDDLGSAAESLVGTAGTAEGPRPPIVIRAATADGSWRRLEIVANNLLADERIRAITIVAREVATDTADERARRATERRLDAAFDGASIGMALIGPGGRFLRVNPALCQLLGFTADELIARAASDLAHPEELDEGLDALVAIATGAVEAFEGERRMRRRDDTYVWVRMAISLVRDDAGAPLYFATQVIDLSERVAAEEARRAQEEQYRLIVESTHQGVWLIDEHAITTFVNPAVAQMLGYAQEEMLGRHIFDFMDDERRTEATANLARRRDGLRDRHPFCLQHARGHDVWIEVDSSPLTDADGAYAGAITLLTDVTEERHVEAALRHERERFRRLVQESADLIVVATDDGTIDYASPAVEPVLGYRPEDLRGRPLEDLLLVPADGASLRSGTLAPASRLGDTVPNELSLKHRDGSTRYCEVVARNLIDDPSVRGVVVNARDVTDARRAERRLRALFEASNDIVTILHPDGSWFASPAGTRLLGHQPGYEPEGGLLSLVHPDDLAGAAAALEEVLDGRRSASDPLAFRARTADGSYLWLEAVANNLRDDPLVAGVVITARDITERNRQAAALRESEERFAAAFERSPVAIAVIAFDGALIDCNEAYSQIVGVPIPELIGTDAMALVHPDDIEQAVEAAVARVEADGRQLPPPPPIRMLRPAGTEVWVRFDSQIVHDSSGEPSYVVATMNDITEQKNAEEAVRRSEHWFKTLVQNQSDLVTVVGFDGVLTYVSPNSETVLGFKPSELIGTTGADNIHPDDLEMLMTGIGEQIAANAESRPIEYRQRHADGSWSWLEASARMMPPEYGSDKVIVTARDVRERRRTESEQREAEARFREAFASSPVGIGFADLDGRLTWVNRALAQITGIPEALLEGTQFQSLSRAGELEFEIAQAVRLLRGEIDAFKSEKRYDHPDGRTVWGLMHVSLVRDAAGAPAQLLGQVEDITDRKERELVLAHDAEHDNLTGLWNRKGFRRIVAELWADRTADAPVALLFADLDRFKKVNDELGHSSGDEVLEIVGRRLTAAVRAGDTVARWGGDEFVVLCPSVTDVDEAARVAERMRRAIAVPFRISTGVASIATSIGVELDTGHQSPDALLDAADMKAYAAKVGGGDRVMSSGDAALSPSTRLRAPRGSG